MRHALRVVLSVTCLLAPLHAHGGQYKGPNDAGGGSGSGGGNSAPPTNPLGGAAPGPGSPGTGTMSGGGRTDSPRTGSPRGQGSQTSAPVYADAYENWEFWWEANKDSFLDLKSRLVGAASTGGPSMITGKGRPPGDAATRRPTAETIEGRVVPMLETLIRTSGETDILDSAIVALARAGDPSSRGDVVPLAIGLLAHKELSVQSAATLALGIGRRPEAVPTLQALMAGSAEGRRLMGGSSVPSLVRAFAALSLGLLDDAGSVPRLLEMLDSTKDTERDLKVAAITALGLMTPRDDAFRWLLGHLQDRKLDALIASHVPIALGRLGNPEAVAPLLATFTARDTDALVRQSAAIALGQLGGLGQQSVVDALVACIREGRDQQTRHFCFISLAQIAARDGSSDGAAPGERLAPLVKLFCDEIARPSRADHRSWAALAAAILGRADEPSRAAFQPRLIEAWEREKEPSFRSADALALGLLRVASMGAPLLQDYRTSGDADHRGYTALALGFLGHREAAELLRAQCAQRTQVPSYRLQVATALGLMGDTEAVAVLVTALQDAETLGVSSAVARALGLIGDGTAIDPLHALALAADKAPIARAFAAVALGRLCEMSALPWNARLAANNNYRARVPALDEVLDIQ